MIDEKRDEPGQEPVLGENGAVITGKVVPSPKDTVLKEAGAAQTPTDATADDAALPEEEAAEPADALTDSILAEDWGRIPGAAKTS